MQERVVLENSRWFQVSNAALAAATKATGLNSVKYISYFFLVTKRKIVRVRANYRNEKNFICTNTNNKYTYIIIVIENKISRKENTNI